VSAPYRPGQPQWPDNRPQRPERPPPIQFRQEDPPPRQQQGNKALAWVLRGAGLVAVAVISGLVWYYITNDAPPENTAGDDGSTEQTEGVYDFQPHEMPRAETQYTCPEHAYGEIKRFLENTQCERLDRQLFTTEVKGRTVYTSVSVVTMATEADAAALRELANEDGSGNVSDVVRDGVIDIEGLDRLSGGEGYASNQRDREVIIVESDFDPKDKPAEGQEEALEKEILDPVCEDALRLGPEIAAGQG
jgi:hypothetical protein